MANNAMQLTQENLDFTDKFDGFEVRKQIPWLRALLDQAERQQQTLFVIMTYRYEEFKFVRESITIMDEENFNRRFVFVDAEKAGFSQVLLRDYVEE